MPSHDRTPASVLNAPRQSFVVLDEDRPMMGSITGAPYAMNKYGRQIYAPHPDGPRSHRMVMRRAIRSRARQVHREAVADARAAERLPIPAPPEPTEADLRRMARRAAARVRREEQRQARIAAGTDRSLYRSPQPSPVRGRISFLDRLLGRD